MPDEPSSADAPAEPDALPADVAAAPEVPAQSDLAKPRPSGEPPAVVALREMIEGKLASLGGYLVDNHGNYIVGLQTARTFVVPTWLENGATVVRVFAITNLAVPVTAELTQWLLGKNLEFVFGAFALDAENGAIWFNHNLLGQFAAPEELEATIAAVIETANRFDDEIKSRFGGRLYVEGAEDVVTPPSAPGYL
ncbi:MAG TPA: YbjN domain-containing protein [Actinomycetota bacterium]|nr:YbjN domain-containing protein [Actinomycetota bacterium]